MFFMVNLWIISYVCIFRPLHAMVFAATSSLSGLGILCYGVNSIAAGLGLANLVLYTSIYTPLKRISILNTWVGSIGK